MSELINSYSSNYAYFTEDEDGNEIEGYFDDGLDAMYYDDVNYSANKILGSKDYVLVDGINNRWNGSNDVNLIIRENTLSDIFNEYMTLDDVEIEVMTDKVMVVNNHHDGTNRYDFIPIDLMDLKKSELLDYINYRDYKYDYGHTPQYETKEVLCDYITEYVL